jgi:hypothetical protein
VNDEPVTVRAPFALSVTVRVGLPTVTRVTEKVCVPASPLVKVLDDDGCPLNSVSHSRSKRWMLGSMGTTTVTRLPA